MNNLKKAAWWGVRLFQALVMRPWMSLLVDAISFWSPIKFLTNIEISTSLWNRILFMRSSLPVRIAARLKRKWRKMSLLNKHKMRRLMEAFVSKIMEVNRFLSLNQNHRKYTKRFHRSNKILRLFRNKSRLKEFTNKNK